MNNYNIVSNGRPGEERGIRSGHVIRINTAAYDAATLTVTLSSRPNGWTSTTCISSRSTVYRRGG